MGRKPALHPRECICQATQLDGVTPRASQRTGQCYSSTEVGRAGDCMFAAMHAGTDDVYDDCLSSKHIQPSNAPMTARETSGTVNSGLSICDYCQ